jgi:NAD(P)-dependent dehydrogenase (short-subunit alcohol dehydrogenase family)
MGNQQKIAIVTGAASGIGKASAERLLREGMCVIVTDIERESGEAVVRKALAAGFVSEYMRLDVQDEDSWKDVLRTVERRHRRLDILVNNAGIVHRAPIVDTSFEDFRRVMRVNVDGTFLGLKHCIPYLRASGAGCIVNMSSVAGLKGIPNMSAYSASKWAIRSLTKSAALECARDNIRVNSVHPGLIDTPINDSLVEAHSEERSAKVSKWANDIVPIGRCGTAEDVASAVAWLVSEESHYLTGAEIVVDGGLMLP